MKSVPRSILLIGMLLVIIAVLFPPVEAVTRSEERLKGFVGGQALRTEVLVSRFEGWGILGKVQRYTLLSEKDGPPNPEPTKATRTVVIEEAGIDWSVLGAEVGAIALCALLLLFLTRGAGSKDQTPMTNE